MSEPVMKIQILARAELALMRMRGQRLAVRGPRQVVEPAVGRGVVVAPAVGGHEVPVAGLEVDDLDPGPALLVDQLVVVGERVDGGDVERARSLYRRVRELADADEVLGELAAVGEAMVAFVLAAALVEKLGGDSLAEMQPRFAALRRARLEDLPMDDVGWGFGYG